MTVSLDCVWIRVVVNLERQKGLLRNAERARPVMNTHHMVIVPDLAVEHVP